MLRSVETSSIQNSRVCCCALLLQLLLLLWSPPTTVDNGDQTVWRQYSRWTSRATAWRPRLPAGRAVAVVVELFGLETDAQYWDCKASVTLFVCARSFCACTRVRCMRKSLKEALRLSRNTCIGIIGRQICGFFGVMVSCGEIRFFGNRVGRRENGGLECWEFFLFFACYLLTSKKN